MEAGLRAREQEVKRVHKMLEDDFTDGKVGRHAGGDTSSRTNG